MTSVLAKTVVKQQKFLEALDAKERRNTVIVTGVSEVSGVYGGTNDEEKCVHFLTFMGCQALADEFEFKRLGKAHMIIAQGLS